MRGLICVGYQCVGYHGHVWYTRGGGTSLYLLHPQKDPMANLFRFTCSTMSMLECRSAGVLTLCATGELYQCLHSCTATWWQRPLVLYTTTHSWHCRTYKVRMLGHSCLSVDAMGTQSYHLPLSTPRDCDSMHISLSTKPMTILLTCQSITP